jgi:hypothetical protein
MILGLAIPRMHTTWYATKLESSNLPTKKLTPPNSGKKFNSAGFKLQMTDIIKERKWLQKLSWQMLI